jgi:hypothetical protein
LKQADPVLKTNVIIAIGLNIGTAKAMKRTAFILAVLLVACSTSTEVTGVWKSSDLKSSYRNICIAATTDDLTARQIVEDEMHKQLQKNGVKSTKMTDLLPQKFTGTVDEKDIIIDKVRKNGNDAILAFTLIKKKEETRYVPGSAQYMPYWDYYGTFGGYYGYYGPRVYSPGYYTKDEVYYIETNLYDAKTEKLVWSVQSKTYNPSGISQFSVDFTKSITRQLIKSKVIIPDRP